MPGLTMRVILEDIKNVETEALVVGFFQDVRPLKGVAGQLDWLLCGALSDLLLKNKLHGSLGDVALLTSRGKVPAQKIFLVGLGPKTDFSASSLRTALKTAAASLLGAGVTNAAVEYFQTPGDSFEKSLPAFREGLIEGAGGRTLAVSMLAPDRESYEQLSRFVKDAG
jgi:Cytosol aminopeptidase family, N-terminal domain